MDINGYRRVSDDESAEFQWGLVLKRAVERGLRLTYLDIIGDHVDESGERQYKAVEVHDHATHELLGRYTPEEFSDVDYDEEGWFDASGPYHPAS